ncbi:MAG: hypothetical protein LBC88_02475 [Spirochaetaceae bacterium]|jgi:hypothetical protein|nr:hypothetical protein [Spirochaetaceae bacterium]
MKKDSFLRREFRFFGNRKRAGGVVATALVLALALSNCTEPAGSADYPVTGLDISRQITPPRTGAAPQAEFPPQPEFTASIEWRKAGDGADVAAFEADTAYQAVLTLTPAPGYTLRGITLDEFYCLGAARTEYDAGSGKVTITFKKTAAQIQIDALDLSGLIIPPCTGAAPQDEFLPPDQYTAGTIEWQKADNSPVGAQFAANTVYKAVVTLIAAPAYTFAGIAANAFIHTGASNVTFAVNSGAVTLSFPATGLAWKKARVPPQASSYISGIAWNGSKFVAVRAGGEMASSMDGKTWAAAGNTGFTADEWIYGVTYGGGGGGSAKFIAAGDKGKMASSVDGVNWTPVNSTGFGANSVIRGIAYGGSKFAAVGEESKIAYSDDGATWTAVTSAPFTSNDSIYAVTYGGSIFAAVGEKGKITYSNDGVIWTDAYNISGDSLYAIAYGGSKFVAVGKNGIIMYSNDVDWPPAGSAEWPAFVDGINWTTVADDSLPANSLYSIAYGGPSGAQRFIAAGDKGGMVYSADGVTWM